MQLVVDDRARGRSGRSGRRGAPTRRCGRWSPPSSTVSNTTTSRPGSDRGSEAGQRGVDGVGAADGRPGCRRRAPGTGAARTTARPESTTHRWGRTPSPSRKRWAPRAATTTTPTEVTTSHPARTGRAPAPVEGGQGQEEGDHRRRQVGEQVAALGELDQGDQSTGGRWRRRAPRSASGTTVDATRAGPRGGAEPPSVRRSRPVRPTQVRAAETKGNARPAGPATASGARATTV